MEGSGAALLVLGLVLLLLLVVGISLVAWSVDGLLEWWKSKGDG